MAREKGKTLRELFDSMNVREFALWIAFEKECPSQEAANYRAATISASIYNASGNLKAGTSASASDFMPNQKQKDDDVELTSDVLRSILGTPEQ